MSEQLQRDRLADTEKWMERWAALTVQIAILKSLAKRSISKGEMNDGLEALMRRVRKEQEQAMANMQNEMRGAFSEAINEAFRLHAIEQQKTIRLYTRIGIALLVVLVAKDAGSIFTAVRMTLGMP